MLPYLVNLGYFLMLCAVLSREMLRLRALFLSAQTTICAYALTMGLWSIAGWNALFVCINAIWIVKILRERRVVKLPEALRRWYERPFSVLTPQEFLRLWELGRHEDVRDARLTWENQTPASLYFLTKGHVRVQRGNRTIADVPAGFFIGEMSLITGRPATADVDAAGAVEVRCWPTADLNALRERDPALWTKVQSAIGLDLVEKIRRSDERVVAEPA
jgi:CRP-like cAMP-binding protein